MVISFPWAAANIINPMMLLPLTTFPSLPTLISQSGYLLAVWTNSAAGRAWSPSVLSMVSVILLFVIVTMAKS